MCPASYSGASPDVYERWHMGIENYANKGGVRSSSEDPTYGLIKMAFNQLAGVFGDGRHQLLRER